MDEFRARMRRRDAGVWNHFGHDEQDEARGEEGKGEKGAGQGTTRTMCKDDEFVYRGANPRTGIVSPFVFGEGNGNDWPCLNVPEAKTEKGGPTGHSWRENGLGWGLVENASLISTTQSFDGRSSCTKSDKTIQHTKMSGRVNPKPIHMTDEKIQEYQGDMADLCRARRQNAADMHAPFLSVPTQWKPASPTPLRTEMQHIRRKKVGSGQVQDGGLTSPETIKEVGQDSSLKGSTDDITACRTSIVSSTEARRAPLTLPPDHMIHLNCDQESSAISRDTVIASTASKTGSVVPGKYTPCLHFLQPSHAASLGTSYRRPAQFLAIQPRDIEISDSRRNMGSASSAGTSGQPWKSEQRPQVYRKFGTTSIPTMDFHESELENERQYFLSLAPQGNASIIDQSMVMDSAEQNLEKYNPYQGCPMPNLGRNNVKAQRERPVSRTS